MTEKNVLSKPYRSSGKEVESNDLLATSKYRVIQIGESIPSDSEMLLDDAETWLPLSEDRMGRQLIGKNWGHILVTMRTKEPAIDLMKDLLS